MAPKGGKGGGGGSRSGGGSSSSGSSSCSSSAFSDWYPIASITIEATLLLVIITINYLHSGIKKKNNLIDGPLGAGLYAFGMFCLLVAVVLGIVAIAIRECERSQSQTSTSLATAYSAIYMAGVLMLVAVFMIPLTVAVLHRAQKSSKYIKAARITSYVFLALLSIFLLVVIALSAGAVSGSFGGVYERVGIQATYDFLLLAAIATLSGIMITGLVKMRSHGTTPKGAGFWFPFLITSLLAMALLNVIQDLGWYVRLRSFSRITGVVFLGLEFFFVACAIIAILYGARSLNWGEMDAAAAKENRLGGRPDGGVVGVMGNPGKAFDGSSTGTSPMPHHSVPAGAYVVTPQNQSWNGSYQAVPQSDATAPGQPQYLVTPAGTAAPQQQQSWAYQPVSQQQFQAPPAQQQSPVYQSPQPSWQQQNVYQPPQQQQQQFHPGLSGTPVQGQIVR